MANEKFSLKAMPFSIRLLVFLLLTITVIFSLIIAKDFLVPIFLGFLFALLLYPVADRLEYVGLPRILTNLLLILTVFAILGGITFLIIKLFFNFTKDLPAIEQEVKAKIKIIQDWLQGLIGLSPEKQQQWFLSRSDLFFNNIGELFTGVFSATTSTIFKFGILPVYTFMFLYYRNKFKRFLLKLIPHNIHFTAENIIREICEVTPSYLKGLLTVVTLLIFINSGAFWAIGVEHAFFFGLVAALFNLIPYLGTIIGYMIVLIFVLVAQSFNVALGVIITFLIVQFTENNVLTPSITGVYVSINPLITIVAIILGGLVWGLPGMFIIIPFVAMFKIFCDNIPELKPYSFLIGVDGTEEHALTFKKIKGFFTKNPPKH